MKADPPKAEAAGAAVQSSCFLVNSRLRMAIASFLTAASDMRCLWCTPKERVLRRVRP